MATISVIVPVYKSEQYLKRCVDSIRDQSFRDLELLLIDDGSPDNCPAMCDAMASLDNRIRVIHQMNKGVAAARNTGLDHARGEYISFVDSDDWIEPCMYEKMLGKARNYSCDVVMCDCVKEFGDRTVEYSHAIRAGFYNDKQLHREYYPHLLMMENVEYPATISNCLLLIRKECVNDVRYVEGVRFSEDLLFGAHVMMKAHSFFYLKNEFFYHYFMNPNSATHSFKTDKWRDYCILHEEAERCFLTSAKYDFQSQLDKMLLFFVYNAVGDIRGTGTLSQQQKKRMISTILKEPRVRTMFTRTRVTNLPISWKLRLLTLIYKYRVGLDFLFLRG